MKIKKLFVTDFGFGIVLDELNAHPVVAINGWLRPHQLALVRGNGWYYRQYCLGNKQVSQVSKKSDALLTQREVAGATFCGAGGEHFDKSIRFGLVEEEES